MADPITSRVWGWLAGRQSGWAPDTQPNPAAVPSDPSTVNPLTASQSQNDQFPPPLTPAMAERTFYGASPADPYNDGQWSPIIAPVGTNPEADQLRSDAYVQPYTGPLGLDDHGRETQEMRRQYREFHRSEPSVRAAIDGKAAAVAVLDVSVTPPDPDSPHDNAAAEWVDHVMKAYGWWRIVTSFLRPALVDGWSIAEKTLQTVDTPTKWRHYGPKFWGLKHVRSVDTEKYYLRLDGYRNVLGVVSTVRGLRTYDPGKVILFSHLDMYSNWFGQSDMRAVHRACNLITDAYKLWAVALRNYSYPYVHGKTKDPSLVGRLKDALQRLRGSGVLVTPPEEEVALLNLSSATSFDAFEKKVRILREEIFLSIRGAYTPFMQSNTGGGEATGSAAVSADAGSNPIEYLLAAAVAQCLQDQFVPDLVRPNFPPGTGSPIIKLGGTNWDELKKRLDVLKGAQDLGLKLSEQAAYSTLDLTPPRDAGDVLVSAQEKQQQAQQQQPGPDATGAGAPAPGDTADTQAADSQADDTGAENDIIGTASPEEIAAALEEILSERGEP